MPEPDAAVGHAERGPGLAQQPVVRAVVLAAVLGRDALRRTAVQRGHHGRGDAAVRRRVPGRGPGDGGRPVHVPRPRAPAADGRAAPGRGRHAHQQPSLRVVPQTVPAGVRVRGRHAHAAAAPEVGRQSRTGERPSQQ